MKKGYYTLRGGHVVANTAFYPSDHPFSARRLELEVEAERYNQGGDDPTEQADSADGGYRPEARGLEWGNPPRMRPRTPSPPRSRRNSREERRRGADNEESPSSYDRGVREGMSRHRELDAAASDEGDGHFCIIV